MIRIESDPDIKKYRFGSNPTFQNSNQDPECYWIFLSEGILKDPVPREKKNGSGL